MHFFKIWLRRYFHFSKTEWNGVLVLAILIFLLRLSSCVWEHQFQEELTGISLPSEWVEKREGKSTMSRNKSLDFPSKKPHFPFTSFDPNEAGKKAWMTAGLSQKQAEVILRYREKGGIFRKPEDLKKMYVISEAKFRELSPYLVFPQAKEKGSASQYPVAGLTFSKAPLSPLELNSADSASLCLLRGIGPVFAQRIVRYRNRLGGFYKKEQLLEVFGMDSLKFVQIEPQMWVNTVLIKPVLINQSEDESFYHPYLTRKEWKTLLMYRKNHGDFKGIEDVRKVQILREETIYKLEPYLSFK